MSKYPWLTTPSPSEKKPPLSTKAKAKKEPESVAAPKPKSKPQSKAKAKAKSKAKTKPKTKAKKKAPPIPDVDIKGCRYSENVLKDVIKEAGLKAKDKKNVLRAALGQDEDLNRYLNKEEITAGAAIVAAQED